MTNDRSIIAPHSGDVAFHPSHLENQTSKISHTKSGTGIQQLRDTIQVVEFLLGDEHFAVDLFEVREGVYTRITHLPDTPPAYQGYHRFE